jgi:F-type H+-transporting ATPase subunit gamma
MRADLARLDSGRDFGFGAIDKVLKSDPYMTRKSQGLTVGGGKTVIVPITSDRGLCGGINSGIVREIRARLSNVPNRSLYSIVSIGEKGTSALARSFPDLLRASISEVCTPLNFPTVSSIAQQISTYATGCDKIIIHFNEFKSAIRYVPRDVELIPKEKFAQIMKFKRLYKPGSPDNNTTNPALYDLYLSSNFYNAYLNNMASEQSARMTAMENASKNAKEITEKLKLEYNKARQARITMELVEIISGASAV